MFTRDEIQLILDALRRHSGRAKHGGGNWQDYYLRYEPVIERLADILHTAPPDSEFHLTATPERIKSMTDEQLAAIRARYEAATAGKWEIKQGSSFYDPSVVDANGWLIANCAIPARVSPEDEANALFIAHTREDVPALLAEVERLRRLLSSGAAA